MAGEWREVTLGDLFKVKHGFAFKGEFFTDEPQPEVLVTPGNFAIGGGFQDDKHKYYRGPVPTDYVLRPGQVVVTMTDLSKQSDTLGFAARVPNDTNVWLHNQRVGLLVFNPSAETDARFVEYLLRSHEYRSWIVGSATGTTVKHTSPSRIEGFRTLVPAPEEQRAIAHILGTLDNKIELNRRRNQILEAMARALFKDWFVDFGPVRAKMEGRPSYLPADIWQFFPDRLDDEGKPEGWKVEALEDVTTELRRGISPSYLKSGGTRVLNQKCIRNRQINFGFARRHDNDKRNIEGRKLIAGDILVNSTGVGTLGRVGQLWRVDEPTVVDSHVSVVRPNADVVSVCYLGLNLTGREAEIEMLGEGSTGQTELSKGRLSSLPVLVPPRDILDRFDTETSPLLNAIFRNTEESSTLHRIRNTLLPQLICGELRIADAERFIEERAA